MRLAKEGEAGSIETTFRDICDEQTTTNISFRETCDERTRTNTSFCEACDEQTRTSTSFRETCDEPFNKHCTKVVSGTGINDNLADAGVAIHLVWRSQWSTSRRIWRGSSTQIRSDSGGGLSP